MIYINNALFRTDRFDFEKADTSDHQPSDTADDNASGLKICVDDSSDETTNESVTNFSVLCKLKMRTFCFYQHFIIKYHT